jgi:predicted GIY-YIG superfamily endonuclease
VYILQDARKKLYFGYSGDLKQRVENHKHKGVATTKTYSEPRLIWYCAFTDKKKALNFEEYLKAGSGHAFAKKHLI